MSIERARGASCALLVACCLLAACGDDAPANPGVSDASVPLDAGDDGGVMNSCEFTAPTSCPSPALTYDDVAPIFQSRCVHCHSGASDLWPLTNYDHAAAWYDTIHDQILSCGMPPLDAGVPITSEERVKILTWLVCGYPP